MGCEAFFSRTKDLTSKRFFHGFISNTKSDSLLTQYWQTTSEKKSYFLIKYSMESIGEFRLCYVDSTGAIEFIVIRNSEGSFKIENGQSFDSWKKLIYAMSKLYHIGKPISK
eukprot:TRINITY_DN10674_c0_g1_i2.p1 TRINITY_DN10674_c0_g1~~TRINITY_DN10674_c0_g1_i2.p1  ORF type:complete len:125 (-),score=25.05 TRINITY_DN10674_c0_g1_i2:8-343(-)